MVFVGTLLTERLRLRPLGAGDKGFIGQLLRDEAVRRYLGGTIAPDRLVPAVDYYFDRSHGEAVWLVETRAVREPVGLVSLTFHKDGEDTELSYQFHPSTWGQGYATEAGRCALDVARHRLGLERVIAETRAANMPSRRLLERLAMSELRRVVRFGCEQLIYATKAHNL